MIEQHPADDVRPVLVITPDGAAASNSPRPEALVPAYNPAVYRTPQFRDVLRAAVDERIEELRQETRDAAALLAATEYFKASCMPPRQGTP
ncbi:hypothetical protein [Streptomyces roseifaciens]|uniref:hypothetical protein n=1 Tax=Streptomyces roseifaciens TaxID=1488406 RepID=UPI00071811CC|nr:hypothetical protein [Streptomyces roseifaciens]